MLSAHFSRIERRQSLQSGGLVVESKTLARINQPSLIVSASVASTLAVNVHKWCLQIQILWLTTWLTRRQASNFSTHKSGGLPSSAGQLLAKALVKTFTKQAKSAIIKRWQGRLRVKSLRICRLIEFSQQARARRLWRKKSSTPSARSLSGLTQIKTGTSLRIRLIYPCSQPTC